MKHHAPTAPHLRSPLPVVGMVTLLEERKTTLQAMIAERFRQARASGKAANVKQFTASLRAVKRQLATAKGLKGVA